MNLLKHTKRFLLFCSCFCFLHPINASDENFTLPIKEIEEKLASENFAVQQMRGARFKGDQTKRALLKFDSAFIQVKWKKAARGGEAVNNQPRYELAAYELQKLFLEPEDYVVPPTAVRCLPMGRYPKTESQASPTFKNTSYVFFALQYWLENVSNKFKFDKKRFKSDPTYARFIGNLNIFTYLIKHSDSNVGNFLISVAPSDPRVFVVDNGLAFGDIVSDRGFVWRDIRVKRLPNETIERLRNITQADLENTLGVVAQFGAVDGHLIPTLATQNLNGKKGVRQKDGVIQFGLTSREIKRVYSRLKKLLQRVDSGKIKTF